MAASREIQNIRVMSLGEIVTPSMMKGVTALAALTSSPVPVLLGVIGKLQKEIDSFKLGTVSETDFNNLFISAINSATDVIITTDQFDEAWGKMNPTYDAFMKNLQSTIKYNEKNNQKFILVSFTNPKDIRRLQTELEKNKVAHQTVTDEHEKTHLKSIEGVELLLTYKEKKIKVELVKQVRERFMSNSTTDFTYDIKYIQGNDKLAPNTMETINWDKSNYKTLEAYLTDIPTVDEAKVLTAK